jgi:putative transposase
MFPWARFRQAKGGVKAHVLLDHDDYLPSFVLITEARRSDVKMAEGFPLNPGSIMAMDRAAITITRCSASGPIREFTSSPGLS